MSVAQLVMRWSMTRLPRMDTLPMELGQVHLLPLGLLLAGIACYVASLVCWLRALDSLPLARAYSLLSLSYPLVYFLAALLPGMGAHPSPAKTFGVALVVVGVVLVNAGRGQPAGLAADPLA